MSSSHSEAYATCAMCPKACHTACPVSSATQNESLTAWGKMKVAQQVLSGALPMSESAAKAVHACSGCGKCTSVCQHDNPVGPALFTARGASIQAGTQPAGAASTVSTFGQTQNPLGADLPLLVSKWRAASAIRHQVFTGCSSLVKQPEVIEDVIAVSRALGAPMGVARCSAQCCGYPLYAAGAMEHFRAHATQFARSSDLPHELIVLDPGCAFTLKKLYPEVGVRLRAEVRTVVEVLAENLPHAPAKKPLDERVAYHDACHLGRGLGQYEAPRELLRRAASSVVEATSNRAEAQCSGGGGLLPRTNPQISVEVARQQLGDFRGEFSSVVTTCATSKRMFERAGRRSENLMTVLRRWLEASSPAAK